MKTRLLKPWRIAALATLLAAVPGIVTCDHSSAGALFLFDAMAMDAQTQCMIRPGQTAQSIRPFGTLDLVITNQYWMFPRFRNMMEELTTITGEGPTSPETETHYMSVQRAMVFVDWGPDLAPTNAERGLAQKYFVDGVESFVTAGVAPQTEGAVAVQVIPPELGNTFAKKLKAISDKGVQSPAVWVTIYISLYAQTQDQNVIRSNEMSFPIRLCYGCLVLPICGTAIDALPCHIGQDEPISPDWCPWLANNPGDCEPKCFVGQP